MDALADLNTDQHNAVTSLAPYTLVLAGAGSGKTRVLVHRIAWLVTTGRCQLQQLLAVTFTNKAAHEMRARTESLLSRGVRSLWIGTFHGLAHRMLRQHWSDAKLPQNFQILDHEDQLKTVRRTARSLELDDKLYPANQLQWFINDKKESGIRPSHLLDNEDDDENKIRLYAAYQQNCDRAGLVDFAEILLRAYELLAQNDFLLQHYRSRFRHILVDEFQDTNTLQFNWLRLLAGDSSHLFVVGDDDQSIYSWRGAKVEHMTHFARHFHDPLIFRLERNYRSTGTILAAANALIAHNSQRLGKNLWTESNAGEPILVYDAYNDVDEADFVGNQINHLLQTGHARPEIAILYRSNAQSRLIEEALMVRGIAYRVYGGLRFFDRAEIKDTLAYMRLLDNRNDDVAFERVINTPARGIGERSLDKIRRHAKQNALSHWQACEQMLAQKLISGRIVNAIQNFMSLIEQLDVPAHNGMHLAQLIEEVVVASGLPDHYLKEGREKAQNRRENLQELCNAAVQFCEHVLQEEDGSALTAFIAHSTLETSVDRENRNDGDGVQLMTLHAAKGLEFPVVFLAGLEEDLFPHKLSKEEPGRLEEERRLCYVGITRARQKLYLSHAQRRRLYGNDNTSIPSRFLFEIPRDLLQYANPDMKVWTPNAAPSGEVADDDMPYYLGQRVMHPKFGEGIVTNYEGQGKHTRIAINFHQCGQKVLVLNYARLEPLL